MNALLCPRCMGASSMEVYDENPDGRYERVLKCMSCSHRWDAEASGLVQAPEIETSPPTTQEGDNMPRFKSEEARQRWLAAMHKRRGIPKSQFTAEKKAPRRMAPMVEAETVRDVPAVRPTTTVATIDAALERLERDKEALEAAREVLARLQA